MISLPLEGGRGARRESGEASREVVPWCARGLQIPASRQAMRAPHMHIRLRAVLHERASASEDI